jgi:hypothetical protein
MVRGEYKKDKDKAIEDAAKEQDMIAKFKIMFPDATIVFGKHDDDPIAVKNEEALAAKMIAKKEADDKKAKEAEEKAIKELAEKEAAKQAEIAELQAKLDALNK